MFESSEWPAPARKFCSHFWQDSPQGRKPQKTHFYPEPATLSLAIAALLAFVHSGMETTLEIAPT